MEALTVSRGEKRKVLGQVMTPAPVAHLMAGMIRNVPRHVRVLDPGAGKGALTRALIDHILRTPERPASIHATTWEIDKALESELRAALEDCRISCERAGIAFSYQIRTEDFLAAVAYERRLATTDVTGGYDIAILNPPYRKTGVSSPARIAVRELGLEITNLYAGFVAAALSCLKRGGELVAITPRSFCNGPYFLDFRRHIFRHASIDRIHLYESRTEAFRDDGVLQENVIFHAVRNGLPPDEVVITTSAGPDSPISESHIPTSEVVDLDDRDLFIHLPSPVRSSADACTSTLDELGLQVSTGKVVDFRAREFLRELPQQGAVPLIYPFAFVDGEVRWPTARPRKPSAIVYTAATERLLVPAGHYVLVRRMSSKEERRRVVAAVIDPGTVPAAAYGFENHLNYFHQRGVALGRDLAIGLASFLNSDSVDRTIRAFSGHTQINAADLRRLKYPTRAELVRVGREAASGRTSTSLELASA